PPAAMHVLLAKSDKLPRGHALRALHAAEQMLSGRASCQLFSAHAGEGVEHARAVLRGSEKK
ncbi:MAG TPA: hypothetical protein VMH77_07870, partial [Steroidobacteraceae bacterium]|nr:hypothetical protein [Steroidobacteraceae bacterium]